MPDDAARIASHDTLFVRQVSLQVVDPKLDVPLITQLRPSQCSLGRGAQLVRVGDSQMIDHVHRQLETLSTVWLRLSTDDSEDWSASQAQQENGD
jgi:hypothetical protein